MPSPDEELFDPLDFLDVKIPRGKQSIEFTAEFSRELTVEDLKQPVVGVQTPQPLNKLRDSHHALARTLATGISEHEASLVTGYSASRISILKNDPQFQQLMEFYRQSGTELAVDMRSRMFNLGIDAIEELHDRLHTRPDDMSSALLKDIAKDMADRTGHAPKAAPSGNNTVNINVNLTDRMNEARARVDAMREARRQKVIDHE